MRTLSSSKGCMKTPYIDTCYGESHLSCLTSYKSNFVSNLGPSFRCLLYFNPFNAKLNPICHLLALLGAHHILHVSRIRVKVLNSIIFPGQTRTFFIEQCFPDFFARVPLSASKITTDPHTLAYVNIDVRMIAIRNEKFMSQN